MYQIDQSGKIEQTNRQTIIALSNSKHNSVKISAVEKQRLIKTMLELDYPQKNYTHKIFAAMIFLALHNNKIEDVLIDTEYSGHNSSIKEILVQLFQKSNKTCPEISFGYVGKKSHAHDLAIEIFRNKKKADIIVEAKDILKILYNRPIKIKQTKKTNKKGWRPRSSRGNP